MPPEEGYRRAQFVRPGVRIVMGACEAREEPVQARGVGPLARAYGDQDTVSPVKETATSWFEYDCARLVGSTRLSMWTMVFLHRLVNVTGRAPSADEVRFFASRTTGLDAACVYLAEVANA